MDYENMPLDELKKFAKDKGIKVGNISKEKLIEKLTNAMDLDFQADNSVSEVIVESKKEKSALDSIIGAIDELDETDNEYAEENFEELPLDAVIPVRSITFGTLIYKSTSNNAVYIWNEIGSVQHMTIAALNEMNNYSTDFLRKPMVILLDERAVKQFRLTNVYADVAKINDLKTLFKSDINIISKAIDSALAVNMRDIFISKVRTMYKKHTLTDINVIRLLEKKLQFDLSEDR